jgi:hypothetical protein
MEINALQQASDAEVLVRGSGTVNGVREGQGRRLGRGSPHRGVDLTREARLKTTPASVGPACGNLAKRYVDRPCWTGYGPVR